MLSPMDVAIESSWKEHLRDEFTKPYFGQLVDFLREEKIAGQTIYPPGSQIFNAFDHTPFDQVKVVILGQDPYHGPGQAMGLSFSVPSGVALPPSLKNIYKEVYGVDDVASLPHQDGDLTRRADQGVLLLNAILTVRAREAASHRDRGWEQFTDAVIRMISDHREGVVFMLWGGFARSKKSLIDLTKHHVLEAPHPSPLSAYRGRFGCGHFAQANELLTGSGRAAIEW